MADSTTATSVIHALTKVTFSWYDYILFAVMLLLSAVIGIYFGCFGSKQSTANEYLMGGKTMKVIPIAISLVASHISGTTLLAVPADIYRYGATYWLGGISMIILCIITVYVYLPVFFNLQLISTYEYLERRFDNRTRLFASFLYAVSVFLYLPIVIYIPALAFSAATGINVHFITPPVCAVCIFYTTIGGLKTVVWTDTLQFFIIIGALATVFMLGTTSAGGFTHVWNKALEGQRIDLFDFDLDPTKRETFWIIVVGLTIHFLALVSVHQSCVQKFLAVPTIQDANKSVFFFAAGMVLMSTISVVTGLLMYAKYSDCDPFTTKQVTRNDQLVPYYIMDVARNIPGLSGIFIAGVFSAALSTLSAVLNCLAGTIYEDFVSKFVHKNISQKSVSNILKIIVVVTGVLCVGLVFVIEHMGGLLKLCISFNSVTQGPLLAMFTIGMLFPKANTRGALYGGVGGLIVLSAIVFPAKYFEMKGFVTYPPKPLSTDGCDFLNTSTLLSNTTMTETTTPTYDLVTESLKNKSISFQPPFIFRISHYYYTLIGCIVTMVLGLIISYMTNKDEHPVDKSLLSPIIYSFLPKDSQNSDNGAIIYNSVEKALYMKTEKEESNGSEKQ